MIEPLKFKCLDCGNALVWLHKGRKPKRCQPCRVSFQNISRRKYQYPIKRKCLDCKKNMQLEKGSAKTVYCSSCTVERAAAMAVKRSQRFRKSKLVKPIPEAVWYKDERYGEWCVKAITGSLRRGQTTLLITMDGRETPVMMKSIQGQDNGYDFWTVIVLAESERNKYSKPDLPLPPPPSEAPIF